MFLNLKVFNEIIHSSPADLPVEVIMEYIRFVVVCLILAGAGNATEIIYSYSDQQAWNNLPGSFCGGRRQSPININTNTLVNNDSLIALRFSNWNEMVSGNWSNTGHSLKFTPSPYDPVATTTTHLGQYQLAQFHFHWGANASTGAENLVDSFQYSGELHFVHFLPGGTQTSGSYYTVVAVLLRSDPNMTPSGIWETLNVDPPPDIDMEEELSGVVYQSMLPNDRNYYHFEGSLTTPLCDETVQWYVLNTPVSVPARFFETLRKTRTSNGSILLENYRNVQELNGRSVYLYSSTASIFPTIVLMIFSVLVAMAFLNQ